MSHVNAMLMSRLAGTAGIDIGEGYRKRADGTVRPLRQIPGCFRGSE